MFDVGDRVVCVDDGPDEIEWNDCWELVPSNLVKGRVYTVLGYTAAGFKTDDITELSCDCIAVGVLDFEGQDFHAAERFRKLRDISQSLRELKELAINCPALADACERGGW